MLLSATGKPFSDRDAATVKAARLSAELGEEFVVVPIAGGYGVTSQHETGDTDVIVCEEPTETPETEPLSSADPSLRLRTAATPISPIINTKLRAPLDPTPPLQSAKVQDTRVLVLRPALRAFLMQHFIFVFGLYLTVAAPGLVNDFLAANNAMSEVISPTLVRDLLILAGAILAFVAISKVSYEYIANRYMIGPRYVETCVGIVARKTARIDYTHIRQVNITQSLVGRLLNIGKVEVSSAATAGGEVEFRNVGSPVTVQNAISDYRRRALQAQHDD